MDNGQCAPIDKINNYGHFNRLNLQNIPIPFSKLLINTGRNCSICGLWLSKLIPWFNFENGLHSWVVAALCIRLVSWSLWVVMPLLCHLHEGANQVSQYFTLILLNMMCIEGPLTWLVWHKNDLLCISS